MGALGSFQGFRCRIRVPGFEVEDFLVEGSGYAVLGLGVFWLRDV